MKIDETASTEETFIKTDLENVIYIFDSDLVRQMQLMIRNSCFG